MENDSTNEPARQLSDLQEKVLAILPLPSALLSVVGSTIILLMALESRKRQQWTPYTRLLVALSLSDILYSMSISTSSFLRPKNSSNFVFALGNDASCNASGFLNQLGMSAIFYNAALSFYFLATARFGVSAKQFSRIMEKVIHLISLGHPILTASMGLCLGLYAERRGIMGCWLEFDKRCISEDPEVRSMGDNCSFQYTGFLFYVLPTGCTLISLIVNNLVISRYVQTKVKKHHNTTRKRGSRASLMRRSPSNTSSTSASEDTSEFIIMSTASAASTMRTEVAAVVTPQRSASSDELQAIQKVQHRRLKLVRSQAFLFVASYFLCHIWSVAIASGDFVARSETEELEFLVTYYPVAVLQAFFQPLQGLLNMLVFIRPKYLKSRIDFPRETKWWAFQRAIFGERIRPTIMHAAPALRSQEHDEEGQSEHFTIGMHEDKCDYKCVGDGNHTSDSSSAYSRSRENWSTLTASLGDFDHVIEDGVEDERWACDRNDSLTSWEPPIRRSRQSTCSGTRGSSLEVISENSESIFEAFPTEASIINSVATANKQQRHVPQESPPINPDQREGRWSPVVSPFTSPTERIRTSSSGVLVSRLQAFDADLALGCTPDSPACRWISESPETHQGANTATIILPRRVDSLDDVSFSSPLSHSPRSMASLSPPLANSSGNSVCSTSSTDSPLVPPRRRLSPPPFGNDSEDDDDDDDTENEQEESVISS